MEVEPQHLVEFLSRHRTTLKDLDVYVPWFGLHPGGWRIVLSSLSEGFCLETLQFSVYARGHEFEIVRSKGSKIGEEITEALSTGFGRTMSSENVQRVPIDGNNPISNAEADEESDEAEVAEAELYDWGLQPYSDDEFNV
jgi:hypothetical protein